MIPLINHDSSEGEQWGRYNLPRSYVYVYILLYGNLKIHKWKSSKIMIFVNFRKCYKNAAPQKNIALNDDLAAKLHIFFTQSVNQNVHLSRSVGKKTW